MVTATKKEHRLQQLRLLAVNLAEKIDMCMEGEEESKLLPQLSKQYRETVKEIEELEGMEDTDDEISKLLTQRSADGKSGAVR